jgi:mono/diheme cytochrome c family protein
VVTEVPDHLLRRSKERRAALGLGGDGDGEGAAAPSAAPASDPAAPALSQTAAASVSADVEEASSGGELATIEEATVPVITLPTRTKTPFWVLPILVGMPIYAFIYFGAFGSRAAVNNNSPLVIGQGLFSSNCATCHGANGEGGVGPQLNGGSVLKTWPSVTDHVNWVHTGGKPFIGKTYGAQGHTVSASNVMPAFGLDNGGTLTNDQILDVVCYERVALGGAKEAPPDCPATTAGG